MITQEYLKSILEYNPDTGIWIWLHRPINMFKNGDGRYTAERNAKAWNTRFANKRAGYDSGQYWLITINDKLYCSNRLAWLYMTGDFPEHEIDHKNTDKLDDRWDNLRAATHQQNSCNTKLRNNNTSGLKGVTFSKLRKKYIAQIKVNYKHNYLGIFDCPAAAHFHYLIAADVLHGDFARAN